ncbi:MAG: RraA family protein [Acidobacterium ailaaui]|nr:RraA family protein [Pseudacidobacterium ailaaui]
MSKWKNDTELFSLAKEKLFTALVGDVLDKMGFLHQFLPPQLQPLMPDSVLIGRAMPVLEMDVFEEIALDSHTSILKAPFGLMFEALDDLKENEVYICTGSSPRYALWGGLMTVRAKKLGAAGAVVNGFLRDTKEVIRLGFPVFSMGSYAQDQGPRGKVIDYRIPIEWSGIRIVPGDIVFGDRDGVLIVPREAEEEAFSKAIEKALAEKLVLNALQEGMSAAEAFRKFGIM